MEKKIFSTFFQMNVIQNTLGCMYSANQTLLLWFFFVFDPNVCFLYSQSVMMITHTANWNDKEFWISSKPCDKLMVIINPFSCQPDSKNATCQLQPSRLLLDDDDAIDFNKPQGYATPLKFLIASLYHRGMRVSLALYNRGKSEKRIS